MENKITQEELSSIREANQAIVDLKNLIADYEIKKHYAINKIMQQAAALNSVNDSIIEKYGDVDINIETGEYVSKKDSGRN
jgi:hypothetical protein